MRGLSIHSCKGMKEREQRRRTNDKKGRDGEKSASAPKVKPMDSQWLQEGKKLMLKCEAAGNPSPSFNWYKDGSQLRQKKTVKIKTNKKNSKLHISRLQLEDSGNYTCVVENSLGRESATSYVGVQSTLSSGSPQSPLII
ncbi:hypothetical protein DNTS_031610 [Danionella cerebrum]|uniref:Ig-like domain-containing protein n=1 Tax=Danionella cerebrum TaxID=2873325 RepID=A0A553QJL3_9TELE|nr:hypothetical protein DNTS_031610 [Danionella translucida]